VVTACSRGRVCTRPRLTTVGLTSTHLGNMRIEELILEGFKSYPVRTQITGWDPSFNAITGLNGSGKSNILDAICFVLGLTNMSSVRCSNTSRSVYKLLFSLRCGRRINRISFTSVVRLASQRPQSPSSLTTRTGKTAPLEWRITHR
jgi:hypothetical protein